PRKSIRRLRPSLQPSCCMDSLNAAMLARASVSSAATFTITPIRRISSFCWASAASGQDTAVNPTSLIASRRLTSPLQLTHRSGARQGSERVVWVFTLGQNTALADGGRGPIVDISSFDHFVRERKHLWGKFDTERLRSSQIDDQFELR